MQAALLTIELWRLDSSQKGKSKSKRKTFLVENQKESKQYIVVKALTGKSIVLVVNAKIHKWLFVYLTFAYIDINASC